ncbi:hypothetical protein GCM10023215_57450 [Pseudonocardia yuanmonensis]|uniref:WCX domain-containing protein n=1 Tax=Pseudonocardia yuanmonensis TaxID=1095914 RepID=A0ABP8XKJ9_9PSEU
MSAPALARQRRRPDQWGSAVSSGHGAGTVGTGVGWCVVTASFGDLRHAIRVLRSLAPDAKALDPPEPATALRERADAVAAAHSL